jgi:hypothetical protein
VTTIESIQIAIFVEPTSAPKSAQLVGQEIFPGRTASAFNQLNATRSQAVFTDENSQFTVASAPDRYDIFATGVAQGPSIPSIDAEKFKDTLIEGAANFAKANMAVRLAVVVNASRPTSSPEEAVALFNQMVGLGCTPADTIEVDYKINVPRKLTAAPTPTPREERRISLFRLAIDETPDRLAAALWLINKDPFALIAVSADVLSAAGAVFDETVKGSTYHPEVNETHVDLEVNNGDEANRYARIFYETGKLLPIEIPAIHRSIANDNKTGLIDFKKLTAEKKDPSPKKLCEIIHSAAVLLQSP